MVGLQWNYCDIYSESMDPVHQCQMTLVKSLTRGLQGRHGSENGSANSILTVLW